MHLRTIAYSVVAAFLITAVASAQQQKWAPNGHQPAPGSNYQPGQQPPANNYQPGQQPGGGYGQPVQPNQPVQPQDPTFERRGVQPGMQPSQPGQPDVQPGQPGQPGQPQPPKPPFELTAEEQTQVDQVLLQWERSKSQVRTFDCRFKRWTYDTVFGQANVPRFVELGALRYGAPDKGSFQVDTSDPQQNGKEVPIDPRRAEHWVSDGKSIIEFDHVKKQVIVHKLPPEMQGKAIADSPLPFLFSSDAATLKKRYFIRLVEPPANVQGQIWLDVYPRFQGDAANFHHAQFIISAQKMEPFALQLTQPNGKDYISYRFYDIVVNEPMKIFRSDPFRPTTPFGWTKVVDEPQGANARQPVNNNGRR